MKKTATFIALFMILSSFTISDTIQNFNIVGKWVGEDDSNDNGGFIFDEFGYAIMLKNGEQMGGREFDVNGKKGSMKYKINTDTSPKRLDITVMDLNSNNKMTMRFLMKILDGNTIVLASNFDDTLPQSFTNDNSMTLKRQ